MKEVAIATAVLAACMLIGSFIQAMEGYFETTDQETPEQNFSPDLAGDRPRRSQGEESSTPSAEEAILVDSDLF